MIKRTTAAVLGLIGGMVISPAVSRGQDGARRVPNIVVIVSDDQGYLTPRSTEEAVSFIDRHKAAPLLLNLAYNAVHAPAQAARTDIERIKLDFPNLSAPRAILMAMLHPLDLSVG